MPKRLVLYACELLFSLGKILLLVLYHFLLLDHLGQVGPPVTDEEAYPYYRRDLLDQSYRVHAKDGKVLEPEEEQEYSEDGIGPEEGGNPFFQLGMNLQEANGNASDPADRYEPYVSPHKLPRKPRGDLKDVAVLEPVSQG